MNDDFKNNVCITCSIFRHFPDLCKNKGEMCQTLSIDIFNIEETSSTDVEKNDRILNFFKNINKNLDNISKSYDISCNSKQSNIDIFRGRSCKTENELHQILTKPFQELGPAPKNLSIKNRFNQENQSCFYGAFSEETVIQELKPKLGEYIVIGKYHSDDKFNLFDLSQIELFIKNHNIEDKDVFETMLNIFSVFDYLMRPIQEHKKTIDYDITNLFSKFIKTHKFDGIIYSSSIDKNGKNIVLFEDAINFSLNKEYFVKNDFFSISPQINLDPKGKQLLLDYENIKVYRVSELVTQYTREQITLKNS